MAKKKVEHSKNFEKVQKYYQTWLDSDGERGWSKAMVRNAVVKGWITGEEYEEITGEPYSEE